MSLQITTEKKSIGQPKKKKKVTNDSLGLKQSREVKMSALFPKMKYSPEC